MKKTALLIGLLLLMVTVQAQNMRGVWFAGCNLKIDKYAGVDEYKIDSLYGIEGSIIDFISEDAFFIKTIGEEGRTGNYSKKGDTLHLSVDEYNWNAIVKDQEFKLTLIDSVDYGLDLFYRKLEPSKIPESKLLDAVNLKNTNWKTSYDWGYSILSLNEMDSLDLVEKPKVFITNYSEIRTGTEFGNYQIDTYKNHMFLYLLGRETLSEKVIHFSDYSSGAYSGVLFDCFEPLNNPIPIQKVEMTQEPTLIEYEFVNEMANLAGRYQLQLLDLNEQGVSESVKTVISYLEMKDDFSCKIDAYVTEEIDEVSVLRKLEKNGVWELNPSGRFIAINFNDGQECFLTVEKSEGKLSLFLSSNPWPEEEELNTVLKFKKQ